MDYKPRLLSEELKLLRGLNQRMPFTKEEQQRYIGLEKGYEGELAFDAAMKDLQTERFVLNDLLLEKNSSMFQLDSVHIVQSVLYQFEVKNFQGDYFYENEKFYTLKGKEILNPLEQLNRSNLLLRQILQQFGFNLPIKSYIIFINPEFYLYKAPPNLPIVYPTQLKRLFTQLNSQPSKLHPNHNRLAAHLLALHQTENPYKKVPAYTYKSLQKGIYCPSCGSFMVTIGERHTVCQECGSKEDLETTIVRIVNELKLLFPDRKICTNLIYDWCQGIIAKKRIARRLQRNYTPISTRRWTYYE